tara:strand:- start:189 stop:944 length:756 start_codon:yes stop_codon:yes gene_type:complete
MNRFLLLILIALLTLGLVFLVKKPEILDQIWLWLLGFMGIILRFFQEIWRKIKGIFNKEEDARNAATGSKPEVVAPKAIAPKQITPQDNFKGITLNLIRSSDDGVTTIGMLYLNEEFFCYTLEDSGIDESSRAAVQIPAGNYGVELDHQPNSFAERFEQLYPDWYTAPLKFTGVNKFTSVWIQNEVDELPGQASIVVTNDLQVSDADAFLKSSRDTFKTLYVRLRSALEQGTKVRVIVKSENVNYQNLKAS